MSLPEWDSNGLMPPGCHPATMAEVYERCVEGAPNRERREHLFRALALYFDVASEVLGPISLLASGGFVTAQSKAIGLEVVAIVENYGADRPSDDRSIARAKMLVTQPSIIVGGGDYAALTNVQPFAGSLDGFVVMPNHRTAFERRFERVTDESGKTVQNVTKGFVEVVQ